MLGFRAPVFDGHNDLLHELWSEGGNPVLRFREGRGGHLDLPRMMSGGFAGGFFALFAPSGEVTPSGRDKGGSFTRGLPPPLDPDVARDVVHEQVAILRALDQAGDIAICRSVQEIEAAMVAGRIAAIMHLEGAEAIGPDLEELDHLYGLGLRSIGPVWSRPSIFGHGVPFRHGSDGDTGPGLTGAGRRLVEAAGSKGMIVDTSHLTMRGFHDIAELGLPLVATHSNAYSISPHSRNLTDHQLRAIGETRGMVGLNFATAFLRADGRMVPEGALDCMIRQLDHMIELAGEDHVGLGSDFDGAVVPEEIGSVGGLDVLRERMRSAGYGDPLIAKICCGNWLAAIRRIVT